MQEQPPFNPAPQPMPHQPPPTSNGVAIAGFVMSLIGLFSCGFLSIPGLICSIIGLKREPKGLAIAGTIIGAIGLLLGLATAVLFGGVILAALSTVGGITGMMERQQATEPAAQRIQMHLDTTGQLPDDTTGQALIQGIEFEGHGFRYEAGFGESFELFHPGDDGMWDTDDDWSVTWDQGSQTFHLPDGATWTQSDGGTTDFPFGEGNQGFEMESH